MYTATKATLEQLTRASAAEYEPSGVRVNTSRPGDADAGQRVLADGPGAGAGHDARRDRGAPDQVASGVVFVASDAAAMLHGTILDVDGGISATRR